MVIASAYIEGAHGLTFDCLGVEKKLQNVVKALRSRRGDNVTLEKSSMRYLREVLNRLNKNKYENEKHKNKSSNTLYFILKSGDSVHDQKKIKTQTQSSRICMLMQ